MELRRWVAPAIGWFGVSLLVFGLLGFGVSKAMSPTIVLGSNFDAGMWALERCNVPDATEELTLEQSQCVRYYEANAFAVRMAPWRSLGAWSVRLMSSGAAIFLVAMLFLIWQATAPEINRAQRLSGEASKWRLG
jgi:hypothetical protein